MMKQWMVIYNKELLEMWRSYKLLWVPVVFILLGIMQPVSTYYLPQILESAGGLPEGAVIEIPTPSSEQVIAEMLSQYSTMGVLILVLAGMAIISGERLNRTIGLILVRPMPHSSFITAKWASFASLAIASLLLGVLSGWYYTVQLFGNVNVSHMIMSILIYGLWLIYIISILILMSAWLRSNSAIAFVTILLVIAIAILTSLFERWMLWSPARLTQHTTSILVSGSTAEGFLLSMNVTIGIIIALIIAAIAVMKRQELGD